MRIVPGFDRVVIEPEEAEETTDSGLYLPNAEPPQRGTVQAIGPQVEFYNPGDVVIHGRYAGTPVEIDGRQYIVMHEEDILARLEN